MRNEFKHGLRISKFQKCCKIFTINSSVFHSVGQLNGHEYVSIMNCTKYFELKYTSIKQITITFQWRLGPHIQKNMVYEL